MEFPVFRTKGAAPDFSPASRSFEPQSLEPRSLTAYLPTAFF